MPAEPLRVGEIPYLNSLPFYGDKKLDGCEWIAVPPRQLGDSARSEEIDAGPLSLMDAFSLEDRFEPVGGPAGDTGIAVRAEARSVLLFSRVPVRELEGKALGVTAETATSSRLLRVILEKKVGVSPRYRPFSAGSEADLAACLFIGDEALRRAWSPSFRAFREAFPQVLDLGREWFEWQGLPFVFARWMARKSLDPDDKLRLSRFLDRNLRAGLSSAAEAAARSGRVPGWDAARALDYLRAFEFRLGGPERKAIALFRTLKDDLAAATR